MIAIDGPSASGKGTIARRVADALGFHYLESGALYRLVALASLRRKVKDEIALAKIAADMEVAFLKDKVLLEKEDVSDAIRTEECSNRASEVAGLALVRQALLKRQRAFRRPPGLVADGRDMGTVIFPHAVLKVFLTASVEARAQRRYKQLIDKGFSANMLDLSIDLSERDARDANRSFAPLRAAEGAYLLETSEMTAEQAVEQVLAWYSVVKPS